MLLHNKLPKTQQLKSTNLFCCFCWPEIWKQLSEVVLAQGFSPNCNYCIGSACIHLEAWVVLMNLLPVRVTHMTAKYVLDVDRRTPHRAAWVSSWHVVGFQIVMRDVERKRSCNAFYVWDLGSHTLSLFSYLLINLLISFHLLESITKSSL